MFGSNSEISHGSGGVVPMRFVWPYGGRNVFLSGSFTRWAEHIPMSPMEGCPTVFQVICSLTPGYHQFKFYVDGEWRHDENQPFVSGGYGVVNTVFLAQEPDLVPVTFNPETRERSNMELDDAFVHQGVIQRVPESALEVSRNRISVYLSENTAYDLFPDSGKVIALDVNLPVKQAFHVLHEQGIPMAPLWDFCRGQFVGVLSALDFILILRELQSHGSNLTEEELETHTILAWKEGKLQLNRRTEDNAVPYAPHLVHAGPYDSMKHVALKILQNNISTVPILHSLSEDGSLPQLLHLASLHGILKCLCRYFEHCVNALPILEQKVGALPLGTYVPKIGDSNKSRPFAMLRPHASLADALSLLLQANVSSIPIVSDNDSLLDLYSRGDITALAKDEAYARLHLDEITIHQALQLAQEANSPSGLYDAGRCQMCLRSDPLRKVMQHLSRPGVRRVVIVEAGSKRVEGIITLSDVFRFLLGSA